MLLGPMSGARGRFDRQLVATLGRIAGHVAWEKVRAPHVRTIEDVPRTPDDITPEWLTKALCAGHPGAEVTAVESFGGGTRTSTRRTMRVTYNEAGLGG